MRHVVRMEEHIFLQSSITNAEKERLLGRSNLCRRVFKKEDERAKLYCQAQTSVQLRAEVDTATDIWIRLIMCKILTRSAIVKVSVWTPLQEGK
jgi:hypothetical protein